MEFTLKQFENLNYYSNDSLQKIIASVVNESSNAVLVNMFEDSLVLLDHDEGVFYLADYKFDPKDLTLKIENFEEVQLVREEDEFKTKIYEYFDDEESNPVELAESYRDNVLAQEKFINELINEAMATKDFTSISDYSEVKRAVEEVGIADLEEESFFKEYKERLETHPLTEAKYFDWENPITVSLVETEKKQIVNQTAVQKAAELWKRSEFKEAFVEAALVLLDDVEEGTEKFKELLENFPQIFFLDSADRKTMFGKAILASNELREEMDILVKGIDLLFEKFDLGEMKEQYLAEAGETDAEAETAEKEPEDGEEDETPEDEAKELSPEEVKKLSDKLKKVAEKVEDEKVKAELDDIIKTLDKGMEEGTRPSVVKEAIRLLTL